MDRSISINRNDVGLDEITTDDFIAGRIDYNQIDDLDRQFDTLKSDAEEMIHRCIVVGKASHPVTAAHCEYLFKIRGRTFPDSTR